MDDLNIKKDEPFEVKKSFSPKLVDNIENCRISVLHRVSELVTSYNESNNIEERNSIVSRIHTIKASIPQITSFAKAFDKNLGNLLDQVDLKDRTVEIKYFQNAQNEIGCDDLQMNNPQAIKSLKIKDLLSQID